MTHAEKVAEFMAYAKRRGIDPWTAAPPAFRWLWSRGSLMPPPYFIGFWRLALMLGGFFGALFGVGMWLIVLVLAPGRPSGLLTPWLPVLAGLPFGLCAAAYYRIAARVLGLPSRDAWPLQSRGGGGETTDASEP